MVLIRLYQSLRKREAEQHKRFLKPNSKSRRSETCLQLALAIRDEVLDLEKAGITVIQIDEAALREKLPLHRSEWQHYLDWSVAAFRITASGVQDTTQVGKDCQKRRIRKVDG